MNSLGLVEVCTGLLLIILAFLAYRYPMLISGYNTMPKEEREQYDIVGFKREFRILLSCLGLFIIIIGVLESIDIHVGIIPLIVVCILFSIITIWRGFNYYHSNQKRKQVIRGSVITVLTLIVVTVVVIRSMQPNELQIKDGQIEITGSYGIDIPVEQVSQVTWVEHVPTISMRTNGAAINAIRKGHFKLKNGEKARLFIEDINAPAIEIKLTNGDLLYLNEKQNNETDSLYHLLQQNIE